jgi:hypothetical protein
MPRCIMYLLLNFNFALLEDQVFPHNSLPHILDVFNNSLEMRGGIVRTSDEDVIVFAIRCWRIKRCDRHESETSVKGCTGCEWTRLTCQR